MGNHPVEDGFEPEFDRLAKPKGVQSWRRSNLSASRKTEFMDAIPIKVRAVGPQWEQMERARLKALKAFMRNPEAIGTQYAVIWTSPSAMAAGKVFGAMSATAFRPLLTDQYRWLLARKGRVIYGSLIPRHSATWTEEQQEFYNAHRAMQTHRKSGTDTSIPDDEVAEVQFTDLNPKDYVEGLTKEQKQRFVKNHGEDWDE